MTWSAPDDPTTTGRWETEKRATMRSDPSGGRLPRLCAHGIPGEACPDCRTAAPPRRRWWHIHRDPSWQLVGCHKYEQCRCGARRTTEAYANRCGPVAPGWPRCRDEHGRPARSSGWVMPPAGGWTTSGYPDDPLEPRKWARANPSMGLPVAAEAVRSIDVDPPEYDVLPGGCM